MTNESERYAYQINPEEECSTAARILRLVGTGKRVLELGAAAGSMTVAFKELNQCTVVGVEIDAAAAELARPYCERIIVADIDKLDWTAEFGDDRFDVVVAADVLEHLLDPWHCLEQTKKLLKPEGYLVISIPNVAYTGLLGSIFAGDFPYQRTGLLDSSHLRFFTRHELEIALVASGYLPEAWERVELGPADSEFGGNWQTLADPVKAALAMNPEGNTYQFVVRAAPANREGWSHYLREKKAHEDAGRHSLQQAEQQIAGLNRMVAEQDNRIVALNQNVAELDNRIVGLKQLLVERDNQLAGSNQTVAELNQTVAERAAHIAGLLAERAALLASTSWQVTQPLRWCGHQLKRIRHLWRILPMLLQRGGGFSRTLSKCVEVYRREGLAGMRQRIIAAQHGMAGPSGLAGDLFGRNDYGEWRRRYDTISDEARGRMRARLGEFDVKPLISVLMPTYNPKPGWLTEAIESVRGQLYPHWQLCIADDASTDPAVRAILERYAAEDARIRVVYRQANGHISATSNSALELATGEWIALLDHDDLLAEHALFWVVDAINRAPHARLIYSDEDKIDSAGRRFEPYFKCDWNIDLFYSHNLVTHLGVYHTALLREIGGFREGLEGAQDYDLALRCLERIESQQIYHIPRVLYHWRMHPESTAQSAEAKPYALLAGERALTEHFQRLGIAAQAELLDFGMYRVRYALPETLPLVSLIIPTRNGLQLVRQCVESILQKTTYANYEILIVDNASSDPATLRYFQELESEARVRVVRDDRPFNYSALNNAAVQLARGEVVGLINNDVEVITPEWLSEMVSHALRPGVGAVGARLWYPHDTSQHGGVIVGLGGVAGHSHKHLPKGHPGYFWRANLIQGLSAVTAACLVIRKQIYEEVGGLNEIDLQVAFNDIDFCLRVREAGYRNLWTPYAELYHHESATRGYEDTPERQARFSKEVLFMKQRWGTQLLHDPAYSPNLTLNYEDFSLAWPPRVELLSTPAEQVPEQQQRSRVDKALYLVDRQGLGLEIGPSHNPIAPKKAGFNVRILDHATREELIEKYRGHGVNLDNIEEVDYVWHGEPLYELVGSEPLYDWIIASHVLEHTPDLVDFLQQCEKLLKPEGVLSLVIPDKRHCFDYFRWPSSTGDVLQAYLEKRRRHTPGTVFDHYSMASSLNGNIAWGQSQSGTISLMHSLAEAKEMMEAAANGSEYVDVHQWRFTPASFRLILSDLKALQLVTLSEASLFDTTGCEFFMALTKSRQPATADRLQLSLQAVKELQSGFLNDY